MRRYRTEKLARLLPEIFIAAHRERQDIPHFKFCEGECPDAHRVDFNDSAWADFNVGNYWGGYDVTAWFRATVPIRPTWRDKKLTLRFLVGPRDGAGSTAETLLYVNGTPLQAIDVWHDEAWLPPEFAQREQIQIALKAWSGVLEVPYQRRFKVAELIWMDEPTERFYYLANTLLKTVRMLDEDDLRRERLLETLDEALKRIDFVQVRSERFYQTVREALQFLSEQVEEWGKRDEIKPTIVGVGHAHIDVGWLWRIAHSREKTARTFATVLNLMRQYSDYRFMHSTPQLYKYLKEDYPQLYAQIKERIAEGRWEINGSMWVESDTNLVSGESLIRQIMYGRRYARGEFGVDTKVLWLPDVFGYSWALPQIIVKSGLQYFMTTKISWSQFNRPPYDTFRWRGVDGTEVLTHFITAPDEGSIHYFTYNGRLEPRDVKGSWDVYQQKDVNDELLLAFGWGDGGGGPTQEMLESARAMRNLPGLPYVRQDTVEAFFARLAARVMPSRALPVWDGELYLEYHRGTYTSQAQNKRANRKSEWLYHDAEWLSAIADLLTRERHDPRQELRDGWELILVNQFHDILPGSSIRQVYEDSAKDYARIGEIGSRVIAQAQRALVGQIGTQVESVVVFNALSWVRDDLIELPWSDEMANRTIINQHGTAMPMQEIEEHGEKKWLALAESVPAYGYRTFPLMQRAPSSSPANKLVVSPTELENRYYRLRLNERGQIVSLFDKRNGREVLPTGARANVLQAFEDRPMAFDAWDIDSYYQDKLLEVDDLVEAVVEEQGPLRGTLRLTWRFYDSVITQRMTIYDHTPRIDFRSEVDWRESQVLLKVAFPVAVRATRATYNIQFGSIERPTHWNTSWDFARFEVPAHKWSDLSEGDYGVALLNDCKYGHDTKDNVLRLTLIKSPIHPDALADKSHHVFTYSLLPHAGGWRDGWVAEEAYDLNCPMRAIIAPAQPNGHLPSEYQFASCVSDHVIIETVKQAEDDDAIVARVYESKQRRSHEVVITFGQAIQRAVECNLIEEGESPVAYEGRRLTFPIKPYEIKTFKVWF